MTSILGDIVTFNVGRTNTMFPGFHAFIGIPEEYVDEFFE